LVAVDRERALLDQTGADAIRPFLRLAPDGPRPQPPGFKGCIVGRGTAPLHRHTVGAGQKNATAGSAQRLMEPVHDEPGGAQQRFGSLTRVLKFSVGQPHRWLRAGRIKSMQPGRAAP
jgi:hypothetical protein